MDSLSAMARDRLVVALDGATEICSVALLRPRAEGASGGPRWETLSRRAETDGRAQAKMLLRLMDEMLADIGHGAGDIDAIVVGRGPGTFTGVRIAVATARALSLGLAVPVTGASTLAALAAQAIDQGWVADAALLVPMVDARRKQLFYSVYRPRDGCVQKSGGLWSRVSSPAVCDQGALIESVLSQVPSEEADLKGRVVVVGSGGLQPAALPSRVTFVASDVAAEYLVLGQERLGELDRPDGDESGPGALGAPESVTPIYVRPPDADIHITRMKDPWAGTPEPRGS